MALLIQFFKLIPAVILVLTATIVPIGYSIHAAYAVAAPSSAGPTISDPNLKVEVVFKGLKKPTSMTFLGPNDILVLEKDIGTVQRIINGKMLAEPLLDVNVANENERGLLGIAVAKHTNGPTYVFLYYTEAKVDGEDDCPKLSYCVPGHDPLGNRLYRYELVDNKLVNPKLLLDLSAVPGPNHDAGKVLVGPDQNVYLIIGDVRAHRTQAENTPNGPPPDGTGGILRVTQDGVAVQTNPLGNTDPLNKYYAYGIRNGFGMDFDPITKNLWDTENGPAFGDEINIVEPGFNSGWVKIMGLAKDDLTKSKADPARDLVNFDGKGKYRDPEFVWTQPVAPTALKFFNSNKLGKQYENDIFVGDVNIGNIYHFKLGQQRTGLLLDGPLADKDADNAQEIEKITFGTGFGGITDIQVGPDGYLYILTIQGTIFRIVPSSLA